MELLEEIGAPLLTRPLPMDERGLAGKVI